MDYFETWAESWHFIPFTMCIIMFLIMAVCLFVFFRRRRLSSGNRWFFRPWSSRMFAACCGTSAADSAIAVLKKRYASGEINKEEFDEIKKDISDTE